MKDLMNLAEDLRHPGTGIKDDTKNISSLKRDAYDDERLPLNLRFMEPLQSKRFADEDGDLLKIHDHIGEHIDLVAFLLDDDARL